jgi:hypothetical protein
LCLQLGMPARAAVSAAARLMDHTNLRPQFFVTLSPGTGGPPLRRLQAGTADLQRAAHQRHGKRVLVGFDGVVLHLDSLAK